MTIASPAICTRYAYCGDMSVRADTRSERSNERSWLMIFIVNRLYRLTRGITKKSTKKFDSYILILIMFHMPFASLSPQLSQNVENILYPRKNTVRNLAIGLLLGCSIGSQVSIKNGLIFMQGDSTLSQFSSALYPTRVASLVNLDWASEIAPEIIKKIGYNFMKTSTWMVFLDYRNNTIGMITLRAEVGKILEWRSGELIN